jgi:hypothetical protein
MQAAASNPLGVECQELETMYTDSALPTNLIPLNANGWDDLFVSLLSTY